MVLIFLAQVQDDWNLQWATHLYHFEVSRQRRWVVCTSNPTWLQVADKNRYSKEKKETVVFRLNATSSLSIFIAAMSSPTRSSLHKWGSVMVEASHEYKLFCTARKMYSPVSRQFLRQSVSWTGTQIVSFFLETISCYKAEVTLRVKATKPPHLGTHGVGTLV